jgi:hypothetical protein
MSRKAVKICLAGRFLPRGGGFTILGVMRRPPRGCRPTALIGLNLFIAVSMTIAATKEAAVVPTPPTSVLVSPSLRASQGEAVSKLARLQFSPSLRAL